MVSALMLTVVRAWILPDAETMASRSRFWTFSMVTSLPGSRLSQTLPATAPPRTTATTEPMMTFLPVDTYSTSKSALDGGNRERDHDVDAQKGEEDVLRAPPVEDGEADRQHEEPPHGQEIERRDEIRREALLAE